MSDVKRPVKSSGLIQWRCSGCNRLMGEVTPGSVCGAVCTRCKKPSYYGLEQIRCSCGAILGNAAKGSVVSTVCPSCTAHVVMAVQGS